MDRARRCRDPGTLEHLRQGAGLLHASVSLSWSQLAGPAGLTRPLAVTGALAKFSHQDTLLCPGTPAHQASHTPAYLPIHTWPPERPLLPRPRFPACVGGSHTVGPPRSGQPAGRVQSCCSRSGSASLRAEHTHRTGKYQGPVTGWHGDETGKRPLRPSGMRQEGDMRDETQQGQNTRA